MYGIRALGAVTSRGTSVGGGLERGRGGAGRREEVDLNILTAKSIRDHR